MKNGIINFAEREAIRGADYTLQGAILKTPAPRGELAISLFENARQALIVLATDRRSKTARASAEMVMQAAADRADRAGITAESYECAYLTRLIEFYHSL